MNFLNTLSVACILLASDVWAAGGSDPITNLARNAGGYLQSLCPLMAVVGGVAAIICKQLGNKDGLSWAISAVVLGVLGMSLPAIVNLVRTWTGM